MASESRNTDGDWAIGSNGTVPDPKLAPRSPGTAPDAKDDGTKLPLHEDIMQLCRLGEIGPVQKLLDSGSLRADHRDNEGITPLHWAAINNHYALCKFLIERGADVDAKGGDAVATPTMWAVQKCNTYIVHLLLQSGADPALTDAQGYNVLQLATFDGNVFMLTLLLHQDNPVDSTDPSGHTCLMWAAYKGYPACVDLLLRWGASVNAVDNNGFTALHWAIVKGSQNCMQKLLEYGSDRFLKTADGKNPTLISQECKSERTWHQALEACGYDHDGHTRQPSLPFLNSMKQENFLNRYFFLYPFFVVFVNLYTLSTFSIYVALPLVIALNLVFTWLAQRILTWAPPDMKHLYRTPYLAGIFAGTLFWVGLRWVFVILPATFSAKPLLNLLFAVLFGLCTYFYYMSMTKDPGYVPKAGSRNQQKAVIDELFALWNFNEQHFCTHCMVRKPLRSKHCSRCKRCVAKHDHHCPWVHNCIGANNLRHFFLYILAMEVGVLILVYLVLSYLALLPEPPTTICNMVSESICTVIQKDTFTVVLTIWTALQLTWVTMLLLVQAVQISQARTTFESMRGFGDVFPGPARTLTAALTTGSTSLRTDGGGPSASGTAPDERHHHHRGGCLAQWKKLLGLDAFMATARGNTADRASRNPFSRGILTNCRDFWLDSAPYFGERDNGSAVLDGEPVNYAKMYDLPLRARMRRGDAGGAYHSVDASDQV